MNYIQLTDEDWHQIEALAKLHSEPIAREWRNTDADNPDAHDIKYYADGNEVARIFFWSEDVVVAAFKNSEHKGKAIVLMAKNETAINEAFDELKKFVEGAI